jgi:hypothetical protein
MKFRSTVLGAVLTTGALALSGSLISPAQAQPQCSTAGLGGSGAFNIAGLLGLGSTGCQIGDKVYSDFSFPSNNWNTGSSFFTFTNSSDLEHTFSGSGLQLLAGTYTYTYKVTALNPAQPIAMYTTDFAGSPVMSNLDAVKNLGNNINSSDSIATYVANVSTSGNTVTLTPAAPAVIFDNTLTVTNGRIDVITDSLVQAPGPLPILGAGAAFGFSRKIRRRIKASA